MCINFGPALQGVGGREVGRGGGWGGERGGKSSQVKTRGHQLPSRPFGLAEWSGPSADGPDHSARPKGHHSSRG